MPNIYVDRDGPAGPSETPSTEVDGSTQRRPIPTTEGQRRTIRLPAFRRRTLRRLAFAGVGLAVTATAGGVVAFSGLGSGGSGNGFRGDVLPHAVTLPQVTLTDDTGRARSLPSLQPGHLLLVYFGYTHCPDVCPTTMADLAVALRASTPAVRKETEVVFVSSDPVRDTPAVISRWLSAFDFPAGDDTGFTGPLATIDTAAASVGVPLEPPVRQPDGTYTVQHGAQILAFQNGSASHVWLAGTSPTDYAHDIALLAASTSS